MKTDIVIIGAGSTGGVLANRLSADPNISVTLLEAGGSDKRFFVQMPLGFGRVFYDKSVNWAYQSEPNPGLNDRAIYWPRGKVLGGSSAINAMVYMRGLRHDLDDWEKAGNPGWGYDDVLPYYMAQEDFKGIGDPGYHGHNGPLSVLDIRDNAHPLCQDFIEGVRQAGFRHSDDLNGQNPEGAGLYHFNIRDGRRESSASAYIHPAKKRSNLTIKIDVHVTRILFDGKKATGVEYRDASGFHTLSAKRQVILSGGAVNSPQLLQLSGVGPAARLRDKGVDIVHDLPSVGQNLQDHLAVCYFYKSTRPTLNEQLSPLLGKIKAGLEYLVMRKGPLAMSVNQAGGFLKGHPDRPFPNFQLYFAPLSYTTADEGGVRKPTNPDPFPAWLLCHQPTRPTSRGEVGIGSNDPMDAPIIAPNYLSTDHDREEAVEGGRLLQSLLKSPAFQDMIKAPMGEDIRSMGDAEILADFKARASTVYHPVGTCAMGPDAMTSVVDPQLRVHGLENLRVADASIFPNLTSGNTGATALMLGEKAADLIKQDLKN